LDIEIQRVAPKRKGGCSGLAWVFFILVLAAIALLAGAHLKSEHDEQVRQQKQQRMQGYDTVAAEIRGTIKTGAELASKGEIAGAMERIKAADGKLETLVVRCNEAGDTEAAAKYRDQRGELKKVLDELLVDSRQAEEYAKTAADLEAQVKALNEKRDVLNNKVRDRILQWQGMAPAAGSAAGEQNAAPPEGAAAPVGSVPAVTGNEAPPPGK
jgi:hypothetical protein